MFKTSKKERGGGEKAEMTHMFHSFHFKKMTSASTQSFIKCFFQTELNFLPLQVQEVNRIPSTHRHGSSSECNTNPSRNLVAPGD